MTYRLATKHFVTDTTDRVTSCTYGLR